MVLRGSSIAPPSLQDAEQSLARARSNLRKAKADLELAQAAQDSSLHTALEPFSSNGEKDEQKRTNVPGIGHQDINALSKGELVKLVRSLQQIVHEKEEKAILAQKAETLEQQARSAVFDTLTQLAIGGAAGAIARTSVAPLDRVKILMQTSHLISKDVEMSNRSLASSFRGIIQKEGFFRLWRGNFMNCVRVVPHTATQFVAYDKYKKLIVGEDKNARMTVPMRLTAGALSGMTAATVTHPMDVIRIRLQTQPELKGIADAMRSIYMENGMKTFYKGYVPAMLSLSPFIAINFATMDTLKKWYFGAEDRHMTKQELKKRNPFSVLLLGAMSGIFAQTCCYPLDTMRRRMQLKKFNEATSYNGMGDAVRKILSQEGVKGFYKGMTANALKVVPNNAIRFAAFDFLKTVVMKDAPSDSNIGGD